MSRSRPWRKALHIKLDYVTLMLDIVNDRVKVVASQVYERECGVTLRELRLMRFIGAEPGLTLTRLIELTSLEKTLASKAITTLVRRDLVVRSVGEEDARQIRLELTDSGEAVVMRADPIGRFMEETFRGSLTEEEQAVFRRCLQKLTASGDELVANIERHLKQPAKRLAV